MFTTSAILGWNLTLRWHLFIFKSETWTALFLGFLFLQYCFFRHRCRRSRLLLDGAQIPKNIGITSSVFTLRCCGILLHWWRSCCLFLKANWWLCSNSVQLVMNPGKYGKYNVFILLTLHFFITVNFREPKVRKDYFFIMVKLEQGVGICHCLRGSIFGISTISFCRSWFIKIWQNLDLNLFWFLVLRVVIGNFSLLINRKWHIFILNSRLLRFSNLKLIVFCIFL